MLSPNNNAAMDTRMQISLKDPDYNSFRHIPKRGFAGS